MASLIPGYEYDIFISYRQKDNKYDGWVTEFVDNLKRELEGTFKEDVSVYFDINPHDGLLETHDVDASLKEKLKCLVFIPIISRTFCDQKSFAWEHEFNAFIEQASKDQFGLKIKLPNGNVSNRVLPVRIYDLDSADIRLCESVLGGVLRGIEFIYTEPGVNRPLKPNDSADKNTNKTNYRNQINKVGNAIKEIIQGLSSVLAQEVKEKDQVRESFKGVMEEEKKIDHEKPAKSGKRKLISTVAIVALLIIAGIIAYPKIFKRNTLDKLRSSGEKIAVAVMPFQNLTNDTLTWNVYQEIIQNSLTSYLSNFPEDLQVRQTESINNLLNSEGRINYASITPSFAGKISQKLDADLFIYGNIIRSGNVIRLSAQLTDTKTGEIIKSFSIDGGSDEGNLLPKIDSLSGIVKDFLVISKLEKDLEKGTYSKSWAQFTRFSTTSSPDAYKYYINAINAMSVSDSKSAIKWLSKSVSIDSSFFIASVALITGYMLNGMSDSAKILCQKLYEKRDQMPLKQQLMMDWANAWLNDSPNEEIKYIRQFLDFDNQDPEQFRNLGDKYYELNQYKKAIPEYEKALLIYKKWGTKPMMDWNYTRLGVSYHKTSMYKKEKKLYMKAIQDFPYNITLIYRQAILELTGEDTVAANKSIEKYRSLRKANDATITDATITVSLGQMYSEAGILDKAEKYYRQALSLEPESPGRMNSLAYFLIDKDRNIYEGLELINKALELSPDNYTYLHTKGWGFYRAGKYQEALVILQRSWDIRKKKSIYDHNAYAHLDSAKKAVAGQK
jgi:tetratricopeptide (TPR) repeat protein